MEEEDDEEEDDDDAADDNLYIPDYLNQYHSPQQLINDDTHTK